MNPEDLNLSDRIKLHRSQVAGLSDDIFLNTIERDIEKAINKTLKELIIENPDTINEYSNRRILKSFKQNFGDALLGADE